MSVWPLRYAHGNETVEAFRWTGDDTQRDEPQWAVDALEIDMMRIEDGGRSDVRLRVRTPAGWATAVRGDWIVRRPALGLDFEVCSDAEFRKRCAALPRLIKSEPKRARVLATIWARRKRTHPPLR